MTRERAAELLPIIEAYAKGETVQCSNRNPMDWAEADLSGLNDELLLYRIKPKPLEVWARVWKRDDTGVEYIHGTIHATSESDARLHFEQQQRNVHRIVKLREVEP